MNLRKVSPKREYVWDEGIAYAVGLITTDGNLSPDGRHIDLTSKDVEQLKNFMICIGKQVPLGTKISGYTGKRTPRIQFSDVALYRFLMQAGLRPAKSKTLGALQIPAKYFYSFLRGHFDGDGYFYSYWDKRWKNSFMYYLAFTSASPNHLRWLREKLQTLLGVHGHITKAKKQSAEQLKYAKREAAIILHKMYPNARVTCLTRKRLKVLRVFASIGLTL